MAPLPAKRELFEQALRCAPGAGLPFLPWGLDVGVPPPDASYLPLWDLLRERAVHKRRWLGRPDFFLPGPQVRRDVSEQRLSDGSPLRITRLAGPGGELWEERQGVPGTSAYESTKRFLTSAQDVERYLAWPYEEQSPDVSEFFRLAGDAGAQGVVTYRLIDAIGVVGESCEPEALALASIEQPELILELLATIAARVYRYVEKILAGGARPIFIVSGPEFATPPLLSPRQFDAFVTAFDQPLLAMMRRYGAQVIIHCHGRLDAVLERFVEMGADAIHPLETPPMGDVTLAAARQRVGNRLAFVGGLQIGDMMHATPAEIAEQVRRLHEQSPFGLILSTSATPYELAMTPRLLDNYRAAIDAAQELGA